MAIYLKSAILLLTIFRIKVAFLFHFSVDSPNKVSGVISGGIENLRLSLPLLIPTFIYLIFSSTSINFFIPSLFIPFLAQYSKAFI